MIARLPSWALIFTLGACGGTPRPASGGEDVLCPDGSVNAGKTIRTINCSTVVQYDGDDLETQLNIPGFANAGLKNVDKVLREVNDAATDAQLQFTQTCEMYNGCGLTSDEYRVRLDEAQTHFRRIREKVALLEASQGNPEVLRNTVSELYVATVPPQVRQQSLLSAELVVQAKRAGADAPVVLRGGESLKTGDKLVFAVRVSQPAHVYVFQRKSASGTLDVLFPNPALASLGNPIAASELVRIPPQGSVFTLDDNDIGKENVYLAVSKQPLSDLGAALGQAAEGKATNDGQVEKAMTNLFSQAAPECGEQTRGLEVSKEEGCGSLSRGLTPSKIADDDFYSSESSVKAQSLPGDDVILRTFSFIHER